MTQKIKSLDRETWQDYEFPFDYISYNYYDIEINHTDDNFNVSFIKKLSINHTKIGRMIRTSCLNRGGTM